MNILACHFKKEKQQHYNRIENANKYTTKRFYNFLKNIYIVLNFHSFEYFSLGYLTDADYTSHYINKNIYYFLYKGHIWYTL